MRRIQEAYLFDPAINAEKMIFLSGPRQVGKTTFAVHELEKRGDLQLYFDWDDPLVRRAYAKNPRFLDNPLAQSRHGRPLVVIDEIHKQKNWKNILKGLYDVYRKQVLFMITGSARLDFFRASGDSLVGRYFSYRLLPLGLAEASQAPSEALKNDELFGESSEKVFLKTLLALEEGKAKNAFGRLLEFGGFPEPFLKSDPAFSLRWKRDYASLLIREDIRDLTRIHDIQGIENLLYLLPERVGSPLSINALREDLGVHHATIKQWIEALKKIYLVFSLRPWTEHLARAIKKEEKVYFYDWTMIEDQGLKFENMLAIMLMRMVCRFNEIGLGSFDLRFIRTKDGHEVDFLIIKDRKPFALFEAKTKETAISASSARFSRALKVPFYQVLSQGQDVEVFNGRMYVIPAWRLLMLTG